MGFPMKKPRNKKYKEKPVYKNAVDWAIAGRTKMLAADVVHLMAPMKRAYGKFLLGIADREDWNDLSTQFMIAEALAGMQIASNLKNEIERAAGMLHTVGMRMLTQGKSTCYSQELAAIAWGMEIYKIQLNHCTQAEFGRAYKKVQGAIGQSAQAKIYLEMAA